MKSALMVMYSCVASHCHPQMLLTHVDNPITSKIIHHYSSSCQVTLGHHRPTASAPGMPSLNRLAENHPASLSGDPRLHPGQTQESYLTPSIWETHCPSLCCSLLQGMVGGSPSPECWAG